MLMQQWILSPARDARVPAHADDGRLPGGLDGPVEAMNKLQGWSDISVMHFRDLAVFGEQLLLGIRFGAWTRVNEPEQAANWARYWRPEIQGYIHAYRAVTGVDLTDRADPTMPAVLLKRRAAPQGLAEGTRAALPEPRRGLPDYARGLPEARRGLPSKTTR